jgi:hypothetical protein
VTDKLTCNSQETVAFFLRQAGKMFSPEGGNSGYHPFKNLTLLVFISTFFAYFRYLVLPISVLLRQISLSRHISQTV